MTLPRHDDDPVRVRRRRIARWTRLAGNLGYGLYAVCVIAFLVAFVRGFEGALVGVVTVSLIAGSVFLAPAIVLGYAIKAAEREDREAGR